MHNLYFVIATQANYYIAQFFHEKLIDRLFFDSRNTPFQRYQTALSATHNTGNQNVLSSDIWMSLASLEDIHGLDREIKNNDWRTTVGRSLLDQMTLTNVSTLSLSGILALFTKL